MTSKIQLQCRKPVVTKIGHVGKGEILSSRLFLAGNQTQSGFRELLTKARTVIVYKKCHVNKLTDYKQKDIIQRRTQFR